MNISESDLRSHSTIDREAYTSVGAPQRGSTGAARAAVTAERDGRRFSVDGVAVDLHRRASLSVLLRCLCEQRCLAPGRSVSPEALIATVWAGEKIIRRAARNRLHVAVRALRVMGLEGVLIFDGNGYLLDPAVTFEWFTRAAATD